MQHSSVILKSNPYGLIVDLSPDLPFEELLIAVGDKFRESGDFFKHATLALTFRGRELTAEQERALIDIIVENSAIQVTCIVDEDEKSAKYYQKAQVRALDEKNAENGQFFRGSLQTGQTLTSDSSVVILGDINPGAQVVAKGNILILGCCMGSITAGSDGDSKCFIAALTLKPAIMKIASVEARSAITKKKNTGEYPIDPKLAYLKNGHFQIHTINSSALDEYLELSEQPV